MNLIEALRLTPLPRLALVGGGGKTTAMFRLAREMLQNAEGASPLVFLTTTTHLAEQQLDLADAHFPLNSPEDVSRLPEDLATGAILFYGHPVGSGKVSGLDFFTLDALRALADRLHVPLLIEADGSKRRPLKAPAGHEPALPAWVDLVVVVAGLSGLHQPLGEACVHRPEQFAALSGLALGEAITPQALVRVLTHPQGGLKGIPPQARRVLLLNQADDPQRQSIAAGMAEALLAQYSAVLVASLELAYPVLAVHERVAGILLAAGASTRLGAPKQLLDFRGEPLVRRAVRLAHDAGLSPVVLVTGAHAEAVQEAVEHLPVQTVHNPDWTAGQSASVAAGLRALPAGVGAAVFLLVDQPFVPVGLVRSLVELHAATLSPLVAPLVDNQRGNPVLFDRRTFPDLLALTGDVGGRALFSRYPVAWLPWHDPDVLLDVDTIQDYRRLLEAEA